jgi:intracellular multiplication protein IcmE
VAILVAILGLAVYGLTRRDAALTTPHHSTVAKIQGMSTRPGGSNRSPVIDSLSNYQNLKDSDAAKKNGLSYAAPIVGSDRVTELGDPSTIKPGGTLAQKGPPAAPAPPPTTTTTPNPFVAPPATPPAVHDQNPDRSRSPHSPLPETLAMNLVESWSPHAPMIERIALEVANDGISTPKPQASGAAAGTNDKLPASTLAKKAGKTLLLQAGHGVFAHNVLAVNSDIGGSVIVEVDSGPFVGARLIGTFERKDVLLVVSFKSLTIGDQAPIAIDAIAVAPDTMETAVASSVDEHYMTRIVLPTAAAFVQGLGTALQQGNSTSVLSPLGGTTSTSKLSFAQEIGVAGGAAGQQISQILQKAAPSGPTVRLDKDVSIGVIFLQPVYATD